MKRRDFLALSALTLVLPACRSSSPVLPEAPIVVSPPVPTPVPRAKPKIGLALGGGAARGFAHIGVIKALETSGISADIVVGTSAGSVVGALYAAGFSVFDMQRLAIQIEESAFADWSLFDRGFLKGEALERFINLQLGNKPIESLKRRFAALATDLATGTPAVFSSGNAGIAVRASSAVPGVFSPVSIRGREYVDGGLVSPVPVRSTRQLGADIVIAVDISGRPSGKKNESTMNLMLDTFAIMGNTIARHELTGADVIIQPNTRNLPPGNFDKRHEAILQGEQAGFEAVAKIREVIAAFGRG